MRPCDWKNAFVTQGQRVNSNHGGEYPASPFRIGFGIQPTPAHSVPRKQPYTEKYAIPTVLARFFGSGDSGVEQAQTGAFNLTALVYTPAAVLRVGLAVVFEADNALTTFPTFTAGVQPNWQIRAMGVNPETGRESPLQLAYPPPGFALTGFPPETKPLPDSYEVDTAAQLLRVSVNLDSTQFKQAFLPTTTGCNVILLTSWELNDEAANGHRREELFGKCSVSATLTAKIVNESTP